MTLDLTVNFGIYRFRREKDTQFWCQYSDTLWTVLCTCKNKSSRGLLAIAGLSCFDKYRRQRANWVSLKIRVLYHDKLESSCGLRML